MALAFIVGAVVGGLLGAMLVYAYELKTLSMFNKKVTGIERQFKYLCEITPLKSVDEKLADIGFVKVADSEYYVSYERDVKDYGYTQCLDILHKHSGRHIIQSYDKCSFDASRIGNLCVGLTYYETKLIMKKMRQKGWTSK